MNTTKSTRSASGRIELDVPPERVWKALTDAADLVRWFPLEARVEPGEGGSVTGRAMAQLKWYQQIG